ncbi:uncharacterized protein TM35_000481320 [Trypanosoma theileri]|uniref:Uncharacterized protein n=1 Tax=Trypanosoma theileri TaxID=67003 RepID=A0A1X0NHV6_9TRYP|nr:uncharacterized protein TM35_000481320 [Trypanosoma theileri]ORC84171.1 hypothetical protein TM35_000481320 [Trypanosoma theileri]
MWRALRGVVPSVPLCVRFSAAAPRAAQGFRAPANAGADGGSERRGQANPYKSWEHLNHKWLLLMCVGCLAGGLAAGRAVEVDENALRPPFQKSAVLADAAATFEFRPDLAPTALRVVFLLAARRAGLVALTPDESCAAARGLDDVAGVLRHLATAHRIATEDAASLLAIAALKFLAAPVDAVDAAWRWGRNDTDEAPPRKNPSNGQEYHSVHDILTGIGGLTDAECVALLACHSVGEFHEHVSGIEDVTHIGSRYKLSNEYYKFLLANEKRFFELEVPRTEENKGIERLPKDFVCVYAKVGKKGKKKQCVFNKREVDAILHDKTWRALAEKYASDEAAWSEAFQSAFTKMIDSNFSRLRTYNASAE